MIDVFIYDVVCIFCGKGKKDGVLYSVKLVNLMVGLLCVVQWCNDLDIVQVDDIVFGCVMLVGDQGVDIVKIVVLVVDWDEQVVGVQINCFCVFGLEVVNLGVMKVCFGFEDLVLVGGVEFMLCVLMGFDGGVWVLDLEINLYISFVL